MKRARNELTRREALKWFARRGPHRGTIRTDPARPLKYHNTPTRVGSIRFDSKREAAKYQELLQQRQAGLIKFFLRQVPFDLPGGVRYRLDFLIFYPSGGIQLLEVKGHRTEVYRIKKRQVEELYGVQIVEA